MSTFRIITSGGVLAAGILALAACGESLTGPQTQPSMQLSTVSGIRLIANHIKYKDAGHRPATGHAGSATLTVSALLGQDGMTDVDLVAGSRTGAGAPSISKVQLGGISPTGEPIFMRNENHTSGAALTFSLGGLQRNGRVSVHANIRGVDGRRTDVVFVNEIVKLRPDLVVGGLQFPAVVWTHTPVIITAVLSEVNGDVGARANCMLEIDGAPVDSALGVWVDAGGTVSCAFAANLTEPGEHTVTVRASGVTPGDWSAANNSISAPLTVMQEIALSYSASAADSTIFRWSQHTTDFQSTSGPYHSTLIDTYGTEGRTQVAMLTAYTTEPFDFPDRPLSGVRLAQRTGSTIIHDASYASLPADDAFLSPDSTSGCVTRAEGAIVATFTLCSKRVVRDGAMVSYTSITYRWDAGDVIYWSSQSSMITYCGPPLCPPVYSYSHTSTPSAWGRQDIVFGSDYGFIVDLTSGHSRFRAEPTFSLSMTHPVINTPRACTSESGNWLGRIGIRTTCHESRDDALVKSGSASAP